MPSLTAWDFTAFPSVSKAARHMAHWAFADREKTRRKKKEKRYCWTILFVILATLGS
jgi:hypothetical protein